MLHEIIAPLSAIILFAAPPSEDEATAPAPSETPVAEPTEATPVTEVAPVTEPVPEPVLEEADEAEAAPSIAEEERPVIFPDTVPEPAAVAAPDKAPSPTPVPTPVPVQTSEPVADAPPPAQIFSTYTCQNGVTLTTKWMQIDGLELIKISFPSPRGPAATVRQLLPRTPAASGMRYTTDWTIFHVKGDIATFLARESAETGKIARTMCSRNSSR